MASGKSDYFKNIILDHALGAGSFTPPSTIYMILSTSAWTTSATGTSVSASEPSSGAGYSRLSVTNNGTSWGATSSGTKSNAVDLVFPTATGSWGTVQSFYIADASTNGNILYGGDLTTPRNIVSGDQTKFLAGQLIVSED